MRIYNHLYHQKNYTIFDIIFHDETKTEKENIEFLSNYVRDYIKMLGDKLNEKEEKFTLH